MASNAAGVIAIEALAAAQGMDFHAPLSSSNPLEAARALIRQHVPTLTHDRYFHPDMERASALVISGDLANAADIDLPGLA